jgi:RNAse (barnase) inhibitor barstar
VAEIVLDGRTMNSPNDFFEQFFAFTRGLIPDYGGRNLDALDEDLSELGEPLTVRWTHSTDARARLGDWFDRCYATLAEREPSHQPVNIILT